MIDTQGFRAGTDVLEPPGPRPSRIRWTAWPQWRLRFWIAARALILYGGFSAFAAEIAAQEKVSVGGQLRTRYESRDPGSGVERTGFVSMRTRLQISAALEEGISAFLQLQDVRRWGEESGTLSDYRADNLDLHQGYVEIRAGEEDEVGGRVGRQEIGLGEERLIGSVDWTQQGQSFDGTFLWMDRPWGRIDLLALLIREGDVTGSEGSAHLLGTQLSLDPPAGEVLESYLLHNRDEADEGTRQTTAGVRWAATVSRLRIRSEGAIQRGTRNGSDVSAYLGSIRLAVPMRDDRVVAELGYDHLSGDPSPSEGRLRVFDTLFATNHKYYGFADLFLNIPRDTGGGGLRDVMARLNVTAGPRLSIAADLHRFRLSNGLAGAPVDLGDEVDLTIRAVGPAEVVVTGGFSAVKSGKALEDLGRLNGTLIFGYLMLDVRF